MPKARRIWAMAFAAVLGIAATHAAEPGPSHAVSYGSGTSSCDKFTAMRAVNTHPGDHASIAELNSAGEAMELQGVYATWLQGYLTAVNQQAAGAPDILERTDIEGALAWIEGYCTKNPTQEIAAAAREFVAFERRTPSPKPAPAKPAIAGRSGLSTGTSQDPWGELGKLPLQGEVVVAPGAGPSRRNGNP